MCKGFLRELLSWLGSKKVKLVAMEKLHPDCESLRLLLGTWRGSGHGDYPSIEPFDYLEEVTFGHIGKPFLTYSQKTRHKDTKQPLHAEFGYWRPATDDILEVVLAHPTGIAETAQGSYSLSADELEIKLATSHIGLTSTAKEVAQVIRTITATPQTLTYTLDMAAVGYPLQRHLEAILSRL